MVQGRQHAAILKFFDPFKYNWTWSYAFRINENFIQQLSAMLTCREGKNGELSNQAPKIFLLTA